MMQIDGPANRPTNSGAAVTGGRTGPPMGIPVRIHSQEDFPIETDLIALRCARPDDAPSIAAICTGHLAGKGAFVRASLERRSVLVACRAARIVGAVIWDCEFFGRPFVWLLAVDSARRRAGIASMLMDAFERRHPGQAIFTSTNESNRGMQLLLARLSYEYSGRIDNLDAGDPELFYVKTARAYETARA